MAIVVHHPSSALKAIDASKLLIPSSVGVPPSSTYDNENGDKTKPTGKEVADIARRLGIVSARDQSPVPR